MSHPNAPARRLFLRRVSRLGTGAAATAALPMIATPARAAAGPADRPRVLSLVHTHTGERVELAYAVDGRYVPAALGTLDRFLRDHYSGEVGRIDPRLFDLLHQLQQAVGHRGAFEIISGYRGEVTNARLRRTGGGGVARHSLHLEGRALDLRLPGVALADLRDAARSLRAGGVGLYAQEQFVHVDTGRVRTW
ncbi:DUF882 domain-containing protein [Ideonella sp. A 288]|uniref:DUF882 domain-containing protein n=1 Tax=Ideonella sp. A 288 TaxID=1962181 RepID=UPI000B4B275C|nr:DUF882 domain-containing protein [Ideonella sp. A 288]